MPFFTVVIATYNRRQWVSDAIDSVLNQECKDVEIIVVDDGSTDGTVAHLAARFGDQIRLIVQPNSGPGPARNQGIREACGRYIAFLDSDDLWFPWTLSVYLEAIRRFEEPAIVSGAIMEFRCEAELEKHQRVDAIFDVHVDYLATYNSDFGRGGGTMCLRADYLKASGGFPPGRFYCEEFDLLLRLGIRPTAVQVRQPVVIAVRSHGAGSLADIGRWFAVIQYLFRREAYSRYPGGDQRALERWGITTALARQFSAICLSRNRFFEAWRLYIRTFLWNARLKKWHYLLAFPALFVLPHRNPYRTYKR